ncbi:hypothetical protein HPAG1_1333 [Helicobacter pylori HPAG1]|nr:hypothetical protein HPAG1_1333 [Helicobacter pylori HPAG1]
MISLLIVFVCLGLVSVLLVCFRFACSKPMRGCLKSFMLIRKRVWWQNKIQNHKIKSEAIK